MIDRPAVAIGRAAPCKATHLAAWPTAGQQVPLAALTVARDSFDQTLAVGVNLLWVSDPGREAISCALVARKGRRWRRSGQA